MLPGCNNVIFKVSLGVSNKIQALQKNIPLVCLKKYNSYTSDFCCEFVKKTRESVSNFYGFLTGKFGGTV